MSEGRPPEFLDALRALRDGLQALGVPWMIIGGVAVIAHGVPRYTADVDATVSAPDEPLERIFDVFARQRIVPRIDGALAFARERQIVLLRPHVPSRAKIKPVAEKRCRLSKGPDARRRGKR